MKLPPSTQFVVAKVAKTFGLPVTKTETLDEFRYVRFMVAKVAKTFDWRAAETETLDEFRYAEAGRRDP